ncbi:phosphate ABC transporter substrate-binding/OmpA family protein [uncultured Ruegeria sp.]|uniref:phosphate ABC transporter substrate-binding/OmpA family protein n=1 Tax=uncultured Ruegeria sp. TaxID=259304 RepID=UPI002627917B|nr:phosphate ABC transporter substrate-binding/OmpA family protein [uncultured Ruegeria sp.]
MKDTLKLRKSFASAIAIACAGAVPTMAVSGQVDLVAPDGSLRLAGEFVEFVDGHFVIDTVIGQMRVSASRVTCKGEACPSADTSDVSLRITGSDSIGAELMPLLLSGYASQSGGEVKFQPLPNSPDKLADLGGAQGLREEAGQVLLASAKPAEAFEALARNEAEISMSSRRVLPDEARALAALGAGNMNSDEQEHLLALESIAIVTHPDNPVSEIGMDQLREVFLGNISNWKELNGPDMPIEPIGRSGMTPSREIFETVLFDDTGVTFADVKTVTSDVAAASYVTENKGAISFLPFGVQRDTSPLNIIDSCGAMTVPNEFYTKTEEYPFVRRVYLYSRGDMENELAQGLLDFATSREAEDAISVAGFTSLNIGRLPQHMPGLRKSYAQTVENKAYEKGIIDGMLETASKHDRLSSTFHFRSGSSRLDERSISELARLIEFLTEQPSGTKVKLVGFSDDIGTYDSNRRLSQRRAERLMNRLKAEAVGQLAHIEISTTGYGEIAPAACNSTGEGRLKNRRVEIWIESSVQG